MPSMKNNGRCHRDQSIDTNREETIKEKCLSNIGCIVYLQPISSSPPKNTIFSKNKNMKYQGYKRLYVLPYIAGVMNEKTKNMSKKA
jgi:hypothetical protein